MKKLSSKILLLAVALLTSSYISALVNVYKFGNTNFSGSITYSTKAFEPYASTLLVGTDGKAGGDATYALASVTRSDTTTRITGGSHNGYFEPYATHPIVQNRRMQKVGIVHSGGSNTAPTVFVSVTETHSNRIASILSSNKTTTFIPNLANGGNAGLVDAVGRESRGIVPGTCIATCSTHVFIPVLRGVNNLVTSPQLEDGIAVIHIDDSAALTPPDGTVGLGRAGGTNAVRLDRTVGAVMGARIAAERHDNVVSFTVTDMTCCTSLETLYITGTTSISSGGATHRLFGLVKANLVGDNTLTISSVTTAEPAANRNSVVGVKSGAKSIYLNRVRCMETSSGLMYLIVNGGVETIFENHTPQKNKVYALRLAKGYPLGILRGDIIQNDILTESALAKDFDYTTSLSAIVGAGNVPWDSHTTTSDMQVIGDAVYVSGTPGKRGALNDPGVWKSQAMFDHEGKVVAWTPWERVFPNQADDSTANDITDNTPFFAVDARTGHVWRGRHGSTEVTRTRWNRPIETTGGNTLIRQLAEELAEGCYSVLDLPKQTPGIATNNEIHNSLVLFGGLEKVVFARTKQDQNNNVTGKTDFLKNGNNLRTKSNGLFGVGPIRCLGFSYNREEPASGSGGNQGKTFFFAGTNMGLYALAQEDGRGFVSTPGGTAANVLSHLSDPPFHGGTNAEQAKWRRVADITLTPTTAVSQIVTGTGDRVYFTTLDVTSVDHIVDKLYEMPLAETVSALTPRVIAESGKEGLPANAVFSGCAILTTTNSIGDSLAKQTKKPEVFIGVLSTNNGIYTTTCDLRYLRGSKQGLRQTSAITDPEWEAIVTTTNIAHHSIHRLKDRRIASDRYQFRNTHFWDIPILDDTTNLGIYENSTFLRAGLSGSATTTSIYFSGNPNTAPVDNPVQAKPVNVAEAERIRRFALNEDTTNFNNVDFSVNYYSDGGRRFFVRFNPNEDGVYSSLRTLPFNAARWNMTSPAEVPDDDLSTVKRIFWIENISGTGQLMAGVDDGVLTLD